MTGPFIDISNQPILTSISKATVCNRCGTLIIHVNDVDLRAMHIDYHDELDELRITVEHNNNHDPDAGRWDDDNGTPL